MSDTPLKDQLITLMHSLREETWQRYQRANPFVEDLTDWKERGEFLFGEGKNITVYNTATVVGDVQVGEHTWIGPYTALDGQGGISIGSYCSISSGVSIVTHDTVRWAVSGGKAPYEFAPVTIGDCCFIGIGTTITRGVKIGSHVVIAAGAVITKDIPDYAIVAGVPGEVIGTVVIDGDDIRFEYK